MLSKCLFTFFLIVHYIFPAISLAKFGEIITIMPDVRSGYSWPYFLYVPARFDESQFVPLLVTSNNSGFVDDRYLSHQVAATYEFRKTADYCEQLNAVCLVSAFPRPKSIWNVYIHALDRDSLLIEDIDLRRVDKQLLSMIADAQTRLRRKKLNVTEKVLLYGHSASAMFANRFTFLHPEVVMAVAVISPGGWPIVPEKEWNGRPLRYPIGIYDLEKLSQHALKMSLLIRVPQILLLGDKDENDSVVKRDSYELEDEKLIMESFGRKPIDRWASAEKIYRQRGMNATFNTYKGVAHVPSRDMNNDIVAFFKTAVSRFVNERRK